MMINFQSFSLSKKSRNSLGKFVSAISYNLWIKKCRASYQHLWLFISICVGLGQLYIFHEERQQDIKLKTNKKRWMLSGWKYYVSLIVCFPFYSDPVLSFMPYIQPILNSVLDQVYKFSHLPGVFYIQKVQTESPKIN